MNSIKVVTGTSVTKKKYTSKQSEHLSKSNRVLNIHYGYLYAKEQEPPHWENKYASQFNTLRTK